MMHDINSTTQCYTRSVFRQELTVCCFLLSLQVASLCRYPSSSHHQHSSNMRLTVALVALTWCSAFIDFVVALSVSNVAASSSHTSLSSSLHYVTLEDVHNHMSGEPSSPLYTRHLQTVHAFKTQWIVNPQTAIVVMPAHMCIYMC